MKLLIPVWVPTNKCIIPQVTQTNLFCHGLEEGRFLVSKGKWRSLNIYFFFDRPSQRFFWYYWILDPLRHYCCKFLWTIAVTQFCLSGFCKWPSAGVIAVRIWQFTEQNTKQNYTATVLNPNGEVWIIFCMYCKKKKNNNNCKRFCIMKMHLKFTANGAKNIKKSRVKTNIYKF